MWIGKDEGSSNVAIPLGDVSRGNEESETTDVERELTNTWMVCRKKGLGARVGES